MNDTILSSNRGRTKKPALMNNAGILNKITFLFRYSESSIIRLDEDNDLSSIAINVPRGTSFNNSVNISCEVFNISIVPVLRSCQKAKSCKSQLVL